MSLLWSVGCLRLRLWDCGGDPKGEVPIWSCHIGALDVHTTSQGCWLGSPGYMVTAWLLHGDVTAYLYLPSHHWISSGCLHPAHRLCCPHVYLAGGRRGSPSLLGLAQVLRTAMTQGWGHLGKHNDW